MNDWVAGAVIALSLLSGAVAGLLMLRDRLPQDRTFAIFGLTEAVLLVQLVVGCVALGTTDRDVEGVLFVSYLIGNSLALPIGVFWSLAERTRYGTGVLVVAALTVAALQVRLDTIWSGVGA
ncbi:MAG: hypothetical protein WB767_18290 [Nocardioides sp.]